MLRNIFKTVSAVGLAVALVITLAHGFWIRYIGLYKPVKSFYADAP